MKYSKISYRRARWRTRLHRGSPDQSPQWREFPESATTFHLKTTCDAQKRFRRPLGAGARTRTAQRRAGRATDRAPRGRRRAGARFNTRATARGRGRSPDSGSGGHWARREPRVVQRPAFCTKVAWLSRLGPGVEDFSTLPQFAIEFATTREKKPHAHDDTTIRGTGHGN